MTIKHIKEKLESVDHPIAESIHHTSNFRVLALGFKKGMILKEHKAHLPSKLTVLEGSVNYVEQDKVIELQTYDEVEIPVEVTHSVEALDDSLCLLTQGKE